MAEPQLLGRLEARKTVRKVGSCWRQPLVSRLCMDGPQGQASVVLPLMHGLFKITGVAGS